MLDDIVSNPVGSPPVAAERADTRPVRVAWSPEHGRAGRGGESPMTATEVPVSARPTSGLELVLHAAQDAADRLMAVARAASAFLELALPDEYRVELEVELLDRLGEVADRIRDVLLVDAVRRGSRGGRGGESGEAGIERGVDVHETAPSVGGPGVGAPVAGEASVGAASGVGSSATPDAPSAPLMRSVDVTPTLCEREVG